LAAQISGDKRLIAAFNAGQDVLSMTAQLLLGEGHEVSAEARQMSKAIAYGSLYGAGPDSLRQSALRGYGVVLDEQEARDLQYRFFNAFPGLKRWQRRVGFDGVSHPRTLAGRRRLDVWSYARKLNTPIQGSGANGLKHALGLLWQRRNEAPSSVRPVLLVHDEITVECAREDAEATAAWLSDGMRDGMATFIIDLPVVVNATVGQSWAGEPL
jgi:DNA polymerase-1